MKYCYDYARPAMTADIAVLRMETFPEILLVERLDPPYKDMWALPGGFMEIEETIEEAARRELLEETGLKAGELIRFETYDRPDRDPRGRTITQVFIMIWKKEMGTAVADSDAKSLKWFDLSKLPELAFDHGKIINDVIRMMRSAED